MPVGLLTEVELEQAVAASVAALSGWKASAKSLDTFVSESRDRRHKAFVVEAIETREVTGRGARDKQRGGYPSLMRSVVVVRIAFRLQAGSHQSQRRRALSAEAAVRSAVLGTASAAEIRYSSTTNRRVQEGWYRADLTFGCDHRITLS